MESNKAGRSGYQYFVIRHRNLEASVRLRRAD
jgi:hypothetical protein